jgi:hypothetical protein
LLLGVACVVPLLAGCSLLFVDGPPPNHGRLAYFDCTSSRLAPVTDLVLGGLEGIGTVAALAGGRPSSDSSVMAPAAVAALFVASGIVGFQRVSRCDDAKSQLMRRTLEPTPNPPPLYQPPADPWLSPSPGRGGGWRAPPAPPAPPAPLHGAASPPSPSPSPAPAAPAP